MSAQQQPNKQEKNAGGIPKLQTLDSLRELQRSPLHFLASLPQKYGDLVQVKIFFWPTLIINHPDYIKQVLQDNYKNYDKDVPIFNLFRPLLGNGLVTAYGGESWLRQRRLMQPAFHRQQIETIGKSICTLTEEMLTRWEGSALKREPLDIAQEMIHLTLRITSDALFHSDISENTRTFEQAFSEINEFLLEFFNRPFPPLKVPTPRNRRFWACLRTLDTVVYQIIQQRRQSGEKHEDLLAMLIQARDEEDGQGMSDQQLRDEIMTLLVAGHETAANALAWCWYLLAMNPEKEEKLQEEVDRVLGGRQPTVGDLRELPYTRMVFEEAMRLYPPVWIIMRKALKEDVLGGNTIAANTYILWSTYAIHRHPDFWEEPEKFEPERFSEENSAGRPRHVYIPFSHGPRLCIGNTFAMTEAQLIIAAVAQRYRLKLVPGQKIEPQALMTLRPKNGIGVYVEAR
jgi:cytochrome P450